MLTSAALAVVIVASGCGLVGWFGVPLRGEERLFVGAITGVLAFSAPSLLTFLVAGMGWPTIVVGAGIPAGFGVLGISRERATWGAEWRSVWRRLRRPFRRRGSLRPLALLTVAAGAVTTRTLALAYQ